MENSVCEWGKTRKELERDKLTVIVSPRQSPFVLQTPSGPSVRGGFTGLTRLISPQILFVYPIRNYNVAKGHTSSSGGDGRLFLLRFRFFVRRCTSDNGSRSGDSNDQQRQRKTTNGSIGKHHIGTILFLSGTHLFYEELCQSFLRSTRLKVPKRLMRKINGDDLREVLFFWFFITFCLFTYNTSSFIARFVPTSTCIILCETVWLFATFFWVTIVFLFCRN